KQGGTISLDAEKSLRLESSIGIANAQKLTLEGGSNAKLELENASQFLNQGILELDAENLSLEGGSLEVSGEGKTMVRKSATLKNTFLNLSQTALEGSQVFSVEVMENVEFKVDNSSVQLNQSEIQVETGGSLEFDNSTVEWQGQLAKSGAGSLKFDEVQLTGNASFSGSTEATLNLLLLNNYTLELVSETSSLRFLERFPFSGTQSELKTNFANLVFEKGLELSSGKVSSTGGRIEVHDNLTSNGGSLDLQNSTLALDGTWKIQDGTFASSGNTLELLDNLSLFSSEELSFQNLNLAGNPLVFAEGSSTKLKIHSALSLDDPSEAIQVGDGNLTLLAPVNLNTGTLGADGGTVRFEQGVMLNGGDLVIPNSKFVIGNQFTKSGGMVNFNGTGLELLSDLSLTSDTLLSFESLYLKQKKLTLLSAASGIELQSQLRMDDPNEALVSGDADLKLNQGISIDEGLISSTSGTVSINTSSSLTNNGTLSVSSGTLELGGDFQKNGGSL
ncbi:MAG: hypothetical protein VX560_08460, partial [SAR324 cluster bacterium]|nr:hypothetical protein [SAR324 cluster bacterium]